MDEERHADPDSYADGNPDSYAYGNPDSHAYGNPDGHAYGNPDGHAYGKMQVGARLDGRVSFLFYQELHKNHLRVRNFEDL